MADISINAEQWNSISDADQLKIQQILTDAGSLKPGDQVIGDPKTERFDGEAGLETQGFNPGKDLCKIACDAAAKAGEAACRSSTNGDALATCLAVVDVARRHCRDRC